MTVTGGPAGALTPEGRLELKQRISERRRRDVLQRMFRAGFCPGCEGTFERRQHSQRFCSEACKRAWWNR